MADVLYRVELTASFLERLDSIEAFLVEADAGFAFDDLLAALRVMSPSARADLSVLAQRTPPQGRDELRTQLLAVPATQRGAWLRARLDR